MIHVCSLARLYDTIDETGAHHIVTLLRLTDRVERPRHIAPENHLILAVDDISTPMEGYSAPGEEHVARLIDFVGAWDRKTPKTPMVVHCFAGISRSTAGAFVAACAINPERDEREIAQTIRNASRTAQPNARIVEIADRLLKRDGRMVRAVETLGPAEFASEGIPFQLDLI
ncbi:MAG: protein-tyrosine phosphatase family protein [Pseudolabrys sp.]